MNQGVLYIVATPIGNLQDISQRGIEVLSQVDVIAAEDTRHSQKLLQHLAINRPLQAYHEHNEEQQAPVLVKRLLGGESVALISDAGTPLMSDPGYRLVRLAHEAGIQLSPVPGPCAAIAALSVAGQATDKFCFLGFPPARSSARQHFFEKYHDMSMTLVLYESSHRILACLEDMLVVFGAERELSLCREITKTFETIRKASLGDILALVRDHPQQQKGEFVLVLEGQPERDSETVTLAVDVLLRALVEVLPVKQAAKLASELSGVKKNRLYQQALDLSKADSGIT